MATMEKLEGSKVKLTIEVSAEQFEAATQKAYQKAGKRFNVPGFRKGKAPRKVIENMYGPLAFFDDAFDIVYPEAYQAAIAEQGVEPVDRPDVSIETLPEGETPLVFSLVVAVKPEVELGAYKGIEVEKRAYNVTDDEVDAAIAQLQEGVARMVDVDRPVENGDTVNLDYSGSVDGVKFDGGTAQGQTLTIGSGQFIPGFEEQMVGMAVGEEKDIEVTFPEEYHAENLAGKKAVFAVKVNGIQARSCPPWTMNLPKTYPSMIPWKPCGMPSGKSCWSKLRRTPRSRRKTMWCARPWKTPLWKSRTPWWSGRSIPSCRIWDTGCKCKAFPWKII